MSHQISRSGHHPTPGNLEDNEDFTALDAFIASIFDDHNIKADPVSISHRHRANPRHEPRRATRERIIDFVTKLYTKLDTQHKDELRALESHLAALRESHQGDIEEFENKLDVKVRQTKELQQQLRSRAAALPNIAAGDTVAASKKWAIIRQDLAKVRLRDSEEIQESVMQSMDNIKHDPLPQKLYNLTAAGVHTAADFVAQESQMLDIAIQNEADVVESYVDVPGGAFDPTTSTSVREDHLNQSVFLLAGLVTKFLQQNVLQEAKILVLSSNKNVIKNWFGASELSSMISDIKEWLIQYIQQVEESVAADASLDPATAVVMRLVEGMKILKKANPNFLADVENQPHFAELAGSIASMATQSEKHEQLARVIFCQREKIRRMQQLIKAGDYSNPYLLPDPTGGLGDDLLTIDKTKELGGEREDSKEDEADDDYLSPTVLTSLAAGLHVSVDKVPKDKKSRYALLLQQANGLRSELERSRTHEQTQALLLCSKNEEIKKNLRELEVVTSRVDDLQDQVTDLTEEIQTTKTKNADLASQLELSGASAKNLEENASIYKDSWRKTQEALQTEKDKVARFEVDVKAAEEAVKKAQVDLANAGKYREDLSKIEAKGLELSEAQRRLDNIKDKEAKEPALRSAKSTREALSAKASKDKINLKGEIATIKAELAAAQNDVTERQKKSDKDDIMLRLLTKNKAQLERQLKDKEASLEELTKKLEETTASLSHKAKELEGKTEELAKVQKQLVAEKQVTAQQVSKVRELDNKSKKLAVKIKNLEATVVSAKGSNEEQKKLLLQQKRQIEDNKSKNGRLKEEKDAASKQKKRLEEEVRVRSRELEAAKKTITTLKAGMPDKEFLVALEKEKAILEAGIEKVQRALAAFAERVTGNFAGVPHIEELADPERDTQIAQIAHQYHLAVQVTQADPAFKEWSVGAIGLVVPKEGEQLSEAQAKYNEDLCRADVLKQVSEGNGELLGKAVSAVAAAVAAREAEVRKTKEKAGGLAVEIKELKGKIRQVEEENAKVEKVKEQLAADLVATGKTMAEKTEAITRLQDELEAKTASLSKSGASADDVKKGLQEKENEVVGLKSKLDKADIESSWLVAQVKNVTEKQQAAERQVLANNVKMRKYHADLAAKEKELEELAKKAKQAKKELEMEIEKLQLKLKYITEQATRLDSERDQLFSAHGALENKTAEAEMTRAVAEGKVAEMGNVAGRVQDEFAGVRAEYEATVTNNDAAAKQIDSLQRDIKQLKRALVSSENDYTDTKMKLRHLQIEVSALHETRRKLQDHLAEQAAAAAGAVALSAHDPFDSLLTDLRTLWTEHVGKRQVIEAAVDTISELLDHRDGLNALIQMGHESLRLTVLELDPVTETKLAGADPTAAVFSTAVAQLRDIWESRIAENDEILHTANHLEQLFAAQEEIAATTLDNLQARITDLKESLHHYAISPYATTTAQHEPLAKLRLPGPITWNRTTEPDVFRFMDLVDPSRLEASTLRQLRTLTGQFLRNEALDLSNILQFNLEGCAGCDGYVECPCPLTKVYGICCHVVNPNPEYLPFHCVHHEEEECLEHSTELAAKAKKMADIRYAKAGGFMGQVARVAESVVFSFRYTWSLFLSVILLTFQFTGYLVVLLCTRLSIPFLGARDAPEKPSFKYVHHVQLSSLAPAIFTMVSVYTVWVCRMALVERDVWLRGNAVTAAYLRDSWMTGSSGRNPWYAMGMDMRFTPGYEAVKGAMGTISSAMARATGY